MGTASGANGREALLHGLCELIEHDGLSHAMLQWFIARTTQIDVVDPATLTEDLRQLHEAAAAVGAEVVLVDVTTDISVPVYLAIRNDDRSAPGLFGAGASPVAAYAAERALTEVMQAAAVSDTEADQAAIDRLAAWPALQDCALLPVVRLLSHRREVPLRQDVGDVTSVESILSTVVRQLRMHNIDYYACELTPSESHVSVVTVIAPGLERFGLVHMGIPVIPTGRGWSVWTAALRPGELQ